MLDLSPFNLQPRKMFSSPRDILRAPLAAALLTG